MNREEFPRKLQTHLTSLVHDETELFLRALLLIDISRGEKFPLLRVELFMFIKSFRANLHCS